MGSGSIILNRKPKNGFQGSEKRNTSLSYQKTPNRSNKDKKLIPARNSHITSALNLITYVYVHKLHLSGHFDAVIIRPRRRTQMCGLIKLLHMLQSLF